MLDVETNHQIILLYFKEGLSLRKIARHLSISRDTVKARVVEYEQFKALGALGDQQARSARDAYLNLGPVYDSSNRSKRRLTEEMMGVINGYLKENEARRLDGRKKQQLCNRDIHEKLLVAGFHIGYTTVSEYIRTISGRVQEAFIKQGYGAGSVCEFDWAEVKINVDGKLSPLLPGGFYQRLQQLPVCATLSAPGHTCL
ncbi:MAG TPA: sigma factor-like helix-turn-helix DNA-binding protein [Niastella sp.]|nr:sigma factor-like helix-turn-helix DNA-binding protein [Niastella sp.]